MATRLNMDPGRVTEESRELALAMARLVDDHGDLGGMFAGHTNLDADTVEPLTVVDIAAVYRSHRAALPLVMIAAAAWLQLAVAASPRGREASARWTLAEGVIADSGTWSSTGRSPASSACCATPSSSTSSRPASPPS
ncbi:MAG TPA: hypothetical protein VM324_01210 [Egibacteraceae bacterium]|nr:hypothetical protein [Egibacteraceae bacterium]